MALASLGILIFEVGLVRLFSVVLQYHFVFLAVSAALLGMGIGSAFVQVVQRQWIGDESASVTGALAIAVSIPLVALTLARGPWAGLWPIYGLLAAVPFCAAGAWLSGIFLRWRASSGLLYGADLTGAGIGALGSIALLNYLDTVAVLLLSGALVGLAALAAGLATRRAGLVRMTVGAAAALTLVIVLDVVLGPWDVRFDTQSAESTKTLAAALHKSGGKAYIRKTRWTALARTDLVQYPDPDVRAIFTDGGAGTAMLRFTGDFSKLSGLRNETGYLPFAAGPHGDVAIVGPGGGKDVLLALQGGARQILGIELNPATVQFVRDEAVFNGGIYDRRNVHVVVGEGRTFLHRSQNHFDMIYLSLVFTQASEALGYALTENYVYTVEAFQDYLNRLRTGGWLAMVLHDNAALSKALVTSIAALERLSVPYPQIGQHLAVVGQDPSASLLPLLVLKAQPFRAGEADLLLTTAVALKLSPVYIPRVYEHGLVAELASSPVLLARFAAEAPYDVRPTTDDAPFFYNTERGVPRSLLWSTAILLALSLAAVMGAPRRGLGRVEPRDGMRLRLFFVLIGAGFMMIEVALLQNLVLFLGWPTLSVAVGLAGLLLATGIGSLISQGWPVSHLPQRVQWCALGAAALAFCYAWLLPAVFRSVIFTLPTPGRATIVVMLLFPLGFFLGTAFPSGLRLASVRSSDLVPWLWAVNGLSSVLGGFLAIVLAFVHGFSSSLMVAAILYVVLAILVNRGRFGSTSIGITHQGRPVSAP